MERLNNAWYMVITRYMFVTIIIYLWLLLSYSGSNMEADEYYPMS